MSSIDGRVMSFANAAVQVVAVFCIYEMGGQGSVPHAAGSDEMDRGL